MNPFDARYRAAGEWFAPEFRSVADRAWGELLGLADAPEGPALSAGCGTGRAIVNLLQSSRPLSGFDISPTAVQIARTNHPSADWQVGDAGEPWPYSDSKFAIVVDEYCLHHLDWPARAVFLAEARRVLCDDGVYLSGTNLWSGDPAVAREGRTERRDRWTTQTYPTREEALDELALAELTPLHVLAGRRDIPFLEIVARR